MSENHFKGMLVRLPTGIFYAIRRTRRRGCRTVPSSDSSKDVLQGKERILSRKPERKCRTTSRNSIISRQRNGQKKSASR